MTQALVLFFAQQITVEKKMMHMLVGDSPGALAIRSLQRSESSTVEQLRLESKMMGTLFEEIVSIVHTRLFHLRLVYACVGFYLFCARLKFLADSALNEFDQCNFVKGAEPHTVQ